MKTYQSIKVVEAEPMDRFTAQDLGLVRDTTDVNEPGYLVVYSADYKSWTPSQPFEDGYVELSEGN